MGVNKAENILMMERFSGKKPINFNAHENVPHDSESWKSRKAAGIVMVGRECQGIKGIVFHLPRFIIID